MYNFLKVGNAVIFKFMLSCLIWSVIKKCVPDVSFWVWRLFLHLIYLFSAKVLLSLRIFQVNEMRICIEVRDLV